MSLHVRIPAKSDHPGPVIALPDRVHHLLMEATQQHLHGDLSVAEGLYLAILDDQPEAADALFLLGTLYVQSASWNQALTCFGQLLTLHPQHVDGYFHMAVAYQEKGALPEAMRCYQAVVAIDSQHTATLLALAALLVEQQRYTEAEVHYLRVCVLDPQLAEAEYGLGNLRFWQYRYTDAAAHLTRAAQRQPNHPGILCSLGATLRKQSHLEAAETCLRQALTLDPRHAEAHFNLSVVLLQQGRLEEGWREYEWRFRIRGREPVAHAQPVWDGSALAGKTILIQAEQGFGDTFQFLRYLPLLKAQGARVLFECQAGLRRLLKQCGAIDVLVERTPNFAIPDDFDVHAMLMSLPRIMGTDWDNLPNATPYLQPEPWQLARWQARLAVDPHFKVGVVWSGKPTHEDNPNRLCPIEQFAALAEIPGISVYSLQKGAPAVQFAAQPWADPLKDLHDELNDFADTAAAICALDLVVTVDTSVAHLAGALGKPVWVLLSDAADWRWLSAREDSPWYSNMRLFRQERPGEWDAPFARLSTELRQAVVRPRVLEGGLDATALAYSPARLVSLQRARIARQAGKQGQARYELEALLRSVPKHAEANLLLGEILLEQGQPEAAQAPLMLAQHAWPDHPLLLKLLGMAAQAHGDCAAATRYLERALNGGNEDAETWQAFGQCCQKLGILPEALRAYRRALDWRPGWGEAADKLGQLLQGMGQWEAAIAHYQDTLRVKPDYFPAHFHLGNALFHCGQHTAAEGALRCAVELEPGHASARNNFAVVLKALGRLKEAESQLREAVRLDPAYSEAYNNLGNVLTQQDRLQEAENVFRQALLHDPTNAQAYNNLGIAMQALGAVDAACQCYDTATLLRPNFGQAHWNRALAVLLRGDYAAGFEAYEWGFEAGARLRPAFDTPRWQGFDEPNKTLLVHSEQGFGDTLQFVRFLRQAKQRVKRLVLSCQPVLVELLSHSLIEAGWVDSVISETATVPTCDYHCALMSLPHVLRAGEELGMDEPYLHADTQRAERLAQAIGNAPGLKVGLVWAGLSSHQNDRHRSIGFTRFKPLLKIPGVHFYSLQKGSAEEGGPRVTNLAPQLGDFADTAAAITQLDLVIAVDTAVAHLAGAMGKPTWVLLPFAPDWRWGLSQSKSAWYPTLKLFRQTQRGSWEPVIEQVQLALTQLAGSH